MRSPQRSFDDRICGITSWTLCSVDFGQRDIFIKDCKCYDISNASCNIGFYRIFRDKICNIFKIFKNLEYEVVFNTFFDYHDTIKSNIIELQMRL